MSLFDNLRKKAQETVQRDPDKVRRGVDKMAKMADERTKGRYSEQIARGAGKARRVVENLSGEQRPGSGGTGRHGTQPGTEPGTEQPGTQQPGTRRGPDDPQSRGSG